MCKAYSHEVRDRRIEYPKWLCVLVLEDYGSCHMYFLLVFDQAMHATSSLQFFKHSIFIIPVFIFSVHEYQRSYVMFVQTAR
jgi:hypothetical protein